MHVVRFSLTMVLSIFIHESFKLKRGGGLIIHHELIICTSRFMNHHSNAGIDTGGGDAYLSRYAEGDRVKKR